jgi:hypothetical protein
MRAPPFDDTVTGGHLPNYFSAGRTHEVINPGNLYVCQYKSPLQLTVKSLIHIIAKSGLRVKSDIKRGTPLIGDVPRPHASPGS